MTEAEEPGSSNRIVGFTSLAEYEDGVVEGRVRIEEVAGFALRRVWREGEWWHSVIDVVAALTESADAGTYWRVLKKRLRAEGSEAVTDCNGFKLPASDGKMRATDCATTKTLFRIIQSVPSKRAEPIKRFLAQAGAERLEETVEPSIAIERAIQQYRALGRDDEWIDKRLQCISARNALTHEWRDRGVAGNRMGVLTNQMHKEMFDLTTGEHRDLKGLPKSRNLREQMDKSELTVTHLGESGATTIMTAWDTQTAQDSRAASLAGARIAGDYRKALEQEIGRKVANASNFLTAPEPAPSVGARSNDADPRRATAVRRRR